VNLDESAIAKLREGKEPRILLFDIETAPSIGYYWERFREGNIIGVKRDWFMLCFCYKWLGEKRVYSEALIDYGYKLEKPDDFAIVEKLWHLFNEADVIIAHNGKQFDIRKANARFAVHGLPPPSPYKIEDTKLIAKQNFGFESNKLDELGRQLGLGRKLETGGFELWLECLAGIKKSWAKMVKYCTQDVLLLEQVYLKIRGWNKNHTNLGLLSRVESCPNCQSRSDKWNKNGFMYKESGKFQRYSCTNCGNPNIRGDKIEMAKVMTRNG
jgi:hypothetical protein